MEIAAARIEADARTKAAAWLQCGNEDGQPQSSNRIGNTSAGEVVRPTGLSAQTECVTAPVASSCEWHGTDGLPCSGCALLSTNAAVL